MKWLARWNIEIIFSLLAGLAAVLINAFHYQDGVTLQKAADWMIRYFTFGNPYFIWFFFFIYLLFLWRFYIKCAALAQAYLQKGSRPSPGDTKELLSYVVQPLYLLAPLAIITGPFFTLLGNMSHELRFTRMDEIFASADFFIFGRYPFLFLPHVISSDWIVKALESAYMSLALVLSATLGMLFLRADKTLFRQAVLAFLLSLAISYPFFYAFPCQDPGNYFLRNLRLRPIPPAIQKGINAYNPSPLTAGIVKQIEVSETAQDRDNQVPVSCFPSMHAVWAYFIIYFLAALSPWTLIITIPWTVVVLTGGLYVAQHYFVDYVIAFPIALICIIAALWLLNLEALWKKSNKKK